MTTLLDSPPEADACARPTRRDAPRGDARAAAARVVSIDAVRGLVMFAMIVVNLIAGAAVVPGWLKHLDARSDGITVADAVFPAFLFIVGLSIPLALGGRLRRGEPAWRTLGHVVLRAASLLLLGVIMVNGRPDDAALGWSGRLWEVLMYGSAIAAFCSFGPPRRDAPSRPWRRHANVVVRVVGVAGLIALAFASRGRGDARIVTLAPPFVNAQWWGILGVIGWAYLVASAVYLAFRDRTTPALACMMLCLGLYVAEEAGVLRDLRLERHLSLGRTVGTHVALTLAGLILGVVLATTASPRARIVATLGMIAACAAGAWLLAGPYGVNKIRATPSWSLACCAITAGLWLALYVLGDVLRVAAISRPLAAAGQNVLLAYLLSQMFGSTLVVTGTDRLYYGLASGLAGVLARAGVTAIAILSLTWLLNRATFRLKL